MGLQADVGSVGILIEMLDWGCRINPIEVAHPQAGKLVLGWLLGRLLFLSTRVSSQGCLRRVAWRLSSHRASNQCLYDLVSEVTHLQLCSAGQSAPDSKGGGDYRGNLRATRDPNILIFQ